MSDARKRRLFEHAFRTAGLAALAFAGAALAILVGAIVVLGAGAFTRHEVRLEVDLDAGRLGLGEDRAPARLRTADYRGAIRDALAKTGAVAPADLRALQALISPGAEFALARRVADDPALVGRTLVLSAPLSDDADMYFKGWTDRAASPGNSVLSSVQIAALQRLTEDGRIRLTFNAAFLRDGDSSYPELAGVRAGLIGSLMAVAIAIAIAAPLGVATAVFLEEFAPKNRLTDFLEINVNNLAAVPSIVFGLLGLTAFILVLGLPRSAPLVGGLVLALMSLPTIIIATRTALRALPSSLKQGALALGASRLDAALNPMLPAAAPGIITGVIIAISRALGETAPLLLIGMVAFVATAPQTALDPSSALPVLIYLWAESPERAFVEKTAGAALVLLVLLAALNAAAAVARRRFDPYKK